MPPAPKLPACSVGMGRAPPGQTQLGLGLLVPDLEEGVPGACGYSHAIISDPEAAHTVVVASEDTCEGGVHQNSSGLVLCPHLSPFSIQLSPARSPFMASQMLQLKSS